MNNDTSGDFKMNTFPNGQQATDNNEQWPTVPPYSTDGHPPPAMNYNYVQPYNPQSQPGYNQGQQSSNAIVVVNQPAGWAPATAAQGQIQNIRGWTTGLCGCCEDLDSCCFACWCYPCFLCQLASRSDECLCGPFICGSCFSCVTFLRCFGVDIPMATPNVFMVGMRSKLRGKHGIYGSVCEDLCTVWCCEFCAMTQIARELKHMGAWK